MAPQRDGMEGATDLSTTRTAIHAESLAGVGTGGWVSSLLQRLPRTPDARCGRRRHRAERRGRTVVGERPCVAMARWREAAARARAKAAAARVAEGRVAAVWVAVGRATQRAAARAAKGRVAA